MRARLLLLGLSLVLAGGCGDDGGDGDLSAEDREYVDAAMETFDPATAGPLTEAEGECIAESIVGVLGADGLRERGVSPEQFASSDPLPTGVSASDADAIVDRLSGCVDLSDLLLQGLSDEGSSPALVRCLSDTISEDLAREVVSTMLTGGEAALFEDAELQGELTGILEECHSATAADAG